MSNPYPKKFNPKAAFGGKLFSRTLFLPELPENQNKITEGDQEVVGCLEPHAIKVKEILGKSTFLFLIFLELEFRFFLLQIFRFKC